MATYSGDNYPGHPHHDEPASKLQRSLNHLAHAINQHEDALSSLVKKLDRYLAPRPPAGDKNASNPVEISSPYRTDLDCQTERIAQATVFIQMLLADLEA